MSSGLAIVFYSRPALVGGKQVEEKAPMRCNLRKGGTAHGSWWIFYFFSKPVSLEAGSESEAGISVSAHAVETGRRMGKGKASKYLRTRSLRYL